MLLMVVTMDEDASGGRLLQSQAMVHEEAVSLWTTVLGLRLNLDAAHGKLGAAAMELERQRFLKAIRVLQSHKGGPVLVVTDSQVGIGGKGGRCTDGRGM
jgi:hypothetical protein